MSHKYLGGNSLLSKLCVENSLLFRSGNIKVEPYSLAFINKFTDELNIFFKKNKKYGCILNTSEGF